MRLYLARASLSVAVLMTAAFSAAQPPATTESSAASVDAAPAAEPSAPAGATPTPATVPDAAGAAPATMDAGTYSVRLRDLEERINALKEQVFRSKGRLALLAETVLEGTVGGAQLLVRHENRMSPTFRLERIVYLLDGAQIFPTGDSPAGDSLAEQEAFDVYRGGIVPGEHTLSVTIEYRGHGFGVFSYLQGYHFTVRSSHSFTAPEGRALTLRVVGLEGGGQTTPLEDRPAVRYVEAITDELEDVPVPTLPTEGGD